MALGKTDLCNMALSHIFVPTIANFETDPTRQAQQCRIFYEAARQSALADHDWRFASTFRSLAGLASGGGGWQRSYQYPERCVKFREILAHNQVSTDQNYGFGSVSGSALGMPSNGPVGNWDDQNYVIGNRTGFGASDLPDILFAIGRDYATGKQVIYTDVELAVGRFTYDETDSSKFTPEFTMAFSWYLAALLSGPLTRDLGMAKWCHGQARMWMGSAQVTSDNEGMTFLKEPIPNWIRARGTD
jgi:hypothetical protein